MLTAGAAVGTPGGGLAPTTATPPRWRLAEAWFTGLPVLLLLLCPFMQLGHGVFRSVMAGLLALLVTAARPQRLRPGVLLLPIGFLLSLLWTSYVLPGSAVVVARDARVAAGGALLLFLLACRPDARSLAAYPTRLPLAVLAALLGIALLQKALLARGIDPFPPTWLFANSGDYVLGSARFAFAQAHGLAFDGRVSALFSEPSYLGAMALYLHVLSLAHLRGRACVLASAMALALCALAQTMYGLSANLIVLAFVNRRRLLVVLPLLLAAAALLLSGLPATPDGGGSPIAARIAGILSGEDVSTNIRLLGPLKMMQMVLTGAPFGIPLSTASGYFASIGLFSFFADKPFENGLFNVVVGFGWPGLLALVLLYRYAGGGLAGLFALLLLIQNGASFEFDKIVMIASLAWFCRKPREAAAGSPT